MGTAVASSIAAVVWDTFPELTSRCVMQILDGAEQDPSCLGERRAGGLAGILPITADFWFGMGSSSAAHPRPPVRRLTLCTVLEQACSERPGAYCPLRSGCSYPALALVQSTGSDPTGAATLGSCQPWLYPQPEDDPCLGCDHPKPPGG